MIPNLLLFLFQLMTRGDQRDRDRLRSIARSEKHKEGVSNLKANEKVLNIVCKICKQAFMCTTNEQQLRVHADNKHAKLKFEDCFPQPSTPAPQ